MFYVSVPSDNMASKSVQITKTGALLLLAGSFLLVYTCYTYRSSLVLFLPIVGRRDDAVNMGHLLAVGIQLAQRGGERLWAIRKGHVSGDLNEKVKGETKEGAKELLTRGDLESHLIMRYGLERAFPGLKVVSEEHDSSDTLKDNFVPERVLSDIHLSASAEQVPLSDITVWIDPLDATQEYTEDLLHYVTTMVCITVKGQPTIGIIYQPFHKEIVWGYVDHGVSQNLVNWMEAAKTAKKDNKVKIIVSRSHAGDVEKVVKVSLGENTEVEPAGGAGYKVMRVINGTVNAYVHTTRIKKWDICAGNAILNAVQGKMTTLKGESVDYSITDHPQNDNGLLATVHDHDKFLKVFSEHFMKNGH